jgi:hypothetical protein
MDEADASEFAAYILGEFKAPEAASPLTHPPTEAISIPQERSR